MSIIVHISLCEVVDFGYVIVDARLSFVWEFSSNYIGTGRDLGVYTLFKLGSWKTPSALVLMAVNVLTMSSFSMQSKVSVYFLRRPFSSGMWYTTMRRPLSSISQN